MGLGKFFAKNTLAIQQVLSKSDSSNLENILNRHVVKVIFDNEISKKEAEMTTELLINLISRLYPTIQIESSDQGYEEALSRLVALAKSINNNIEFGSGLPTVVIVIGRTPYQVADPECKIFYVGSDGWTIKHSTERPVGSGDNSMPFAPGLAACIAAANLFRWVFKEYIPNVQFDNDLHYSLLKHHFNIDTEIPVKKVNFDQTILVGSGAIGNAFIWTISKLPKTAGTITIVDPEDVKISNLQRYVMTTEDHNDLKKASLFKKIGGIRVNACDKSWYDFISQNPIDKSHTVVVAVDSALTRIHIQTALPKVLFNGYTSETNLGVSSHLNFSNEACLACDYIPLHKTKDRSVVVAENLGIPHLERMVRHYLHMDLPVNEMFINEVARANNNFPYEELSHLIGENVESFYSQFICGGIVLTRNNGALPEKVDAPLAFQSCISGILLALSYFMFKQGIASVSNSIKVNHMQPWLIPHNPYIGKISLDTTGRCFCGDPDYVSSYEALHSE